MNHRIAIGASLALALLLGCAEAADSLKSGPQPGDRLPGPFHPLNINGPAAGEKSCLVWRNGQNPVVMIFAREVSDPLTSLVKKMDAAVAEHSDARLGSFVVFCNDDESLEKQLKALSEKTDLKKVVLTIDNPSGPKGYDVAKDADVTVVLYEKQTVKASHAFKKGELKEKDVDAIVKELSKILPDKN